MENSDNKFLHLLNPYNLTGTISGTSPILGVFLEKSEDDRYIITYSQFKNASEITNADYYDVNDNETQNIVAEEDYRADIAAAINYILNPALPFGTMFSDVANIEFQEDATGNGIITFAQMKGTFSSFAQKLNVSAGSYLYLPDILDAPSERYGDIFINLDHDTQPGFLGIGFGTNYWTADSSVTAGTRGFKVLLEEISHSLGIDIKDQYNNTIKDASQNNQKFSITSNIVHPDMYFEDDEHFIPGEINGKDIYGPFSSGLSINDIGALQAIYGANTNTRSEDNTIFTHGLDQAFGTAVDDAFVYTIWDGGGIDDEIDATGYLDGVQIDLREGSFSSIGKTGNPNGDKVAWDSGSYDSGNVAIAYGAEIENAKGTAFADHLIGNALDNKLIGGAGNDTLNGGAGFDTADYSMDPRDDSVGIEIYWGNIDPDSSVTDGYGNTDSILEIENVIGTADDDTIIVDADFHTPFRSLRVDFGEGDDTALFQFDTGGITNANGQNYKSFLATDTRQILINENGDALLNNGSVFIGIDTFETKLSDGFFTPEILGNTYSAENSVLVSYHRLADQSGLDINLVTGIVTGAGGIDTITTPSGSFGAYQNLNVVGTDGNDHFTVAGNNNFLFPNASGLYLSTANNIAGGSGDDTVTIASGSNPIVYHYSDGHDTIEGSDRLNIVLRLPSGLRESQVSSIVTDSVVTNRIENYDADGILISIQTHYLSDIVITIDGNNNAITLSDQKFVLTSYPSGAVDVQNFTSVALDSPDGFTGRFVSVSRDGGAAFEIHNVEDVQIDVGRNFTVTSTFYGTVNDDSYDFSSVVNIGNNSELTVSTGLGDDQVIGPENFSSYVFVGDGDDLVKTGQYGDIIRGDFGNDTLDGGAGEDFVYGGAGDDTLIYTISENAGYFDQYYGGVGTDTLRVNITAEDFAAARYELDLYNAYLALNADPTRVTGEVQYSSTGLVVADFEVLEVYIDDELYMPQNVIFGNEEDETLFTTTNDDVVYGSSGNNSISSSLGDDFFDGRGGYDAVVYNGASTGIVVDLSTGLATNDGDGGVDRLVRFEDVVGSNHDDQITGDGSSNYLLGLDGNDTLDGAGGSDFLIGGAGDDTLKGGDGTDVAIFASAFADYSFRFSDSFVEVVNGDTDTVFGDVEWLRFSDRDVELSSLEASLGIAEIENDGNHKLITRSGEYHISDASNNEVTITQSGTPVGPATFPGYSALHAEDDGAGGFKVLWTHTSGQKFLWSLDGSGNFLGLQPVAAGDLIGLESIFATDLNNDNTIGHFSTAVETDGDHDLLSHSSGQYLIRDAGSNEIPVTLSGAPVGPNFYPGFTARQAEDDGAGGFKMLWANAAGQYYLWSLDGAGNVLGIQPIGANGLIGLESTFATDLNNDNTIGHFSTLVETDGDHDLLSHSSGQYLIRNAGNTEIPVTLSGAPVGPNFYPGFTALQAEDDGAGGFKMLWANGFGQQYLWTLDGGGNVLGIAPVGAGGLVGLETTFEIDFNNDNNIGHFSTAVETDGDHDLLSHSSGQYLIRDAGNNEIPVTLSGAPVGPNFYPGFTALQAEDDGAGGFRMLWANGFGQQYLWTLDGGGNVLGIEPVGAGDLVGLETIFEIDLNNDNTIGHFSTAVETDGDHDLLSHSSGQYLIRDAANIEIPVILSGAPVGPNFYPGFTALQAEDDGAGGFRMLWANAAGQHYLWSLDGNGNVLGLEPVGANGLIGLETTFATDLNNDSNIGHFSTAVENDGDHDLLSHSSGQYLIRDAGNNEIPVTLSGAPVGPNFYPGFTALQAEDDGAGGFKMLWANAAGQHYLWSLDGSGNVLGLEPIGANDLIGLETTFATDLNNDANIGHFSTAVETDGDHDLLSHSSGQYLIRDAANNEISVTQSGAPIGPDTFPGYTAVHAEDDGAGGFKMLWNHVSGQHFVWTLDGAGNFLGIEQIPHANLADIEDTFEFDLDNNGVVGNPPALAQLVDEYQAQETEVLSTAGPDSATLFTDDTPFV